ncbi:ATP-binding cassette domain-containing protein [Phragmitibacter flavus]|uniref:ATP-binding cassette domain-containing protein n=1 Tax=Phragmitibacter flavus TaxID=2576071 RepID=A0A5R8KJ52_9BACT|nr:ATP-binding cassette domain-containing protein [Phragmitibacter flavus]TLD71975.1 ATP-binding cassette domain-containing protein [Phragmitibacter flavus]
MAAAPPTTAPILTLSGGTQLSKTLELDQPFHIGSARGAQFRIPHPSLQPQHATLTWNGRFTRIESAEPNAPIVLHGQPLKAPTNLRSGDIIRVGDFEFHYHAPKTSSANAADSSSGLTVPLRGKTVSEIPLESGLTFGSGSEAHVHLDDDTLLPIHAVLEKAPDGYTLIDKGGSGLLANGRYFERHPLLIGDRIDFGPEYAFTCEGWALRRIPLQNGCALTAQNIHVKSAARHLLHNAGFAAAAGEFIGIIGPSGAGKTTLLRTLCGLTPLTEGTIQLNQTRTSSLEDPARYFGYVPQKEIIHLELTGRQALRYAAALRLPARAPQLEIDKLIARLARQLGLSDHLDTPAKRLSGGQLKRLSVAVEMLSRPPLLLLDEPTSGLDPESEAQLMRQLRDLTATGCTVICATHLMENVHLMDSVEILSASVQHGEAGTTVFRGRPSAARDFFKAKDLTAIYPRLQERKPSQWRSDYETHTQQSATAPKPPAEPVAPPPRPSHRRRPALPILLHRQWDILRSDTKNLLLLLGQPLLIGLLLALAAGTSPDQVATQLFLACIATFWMACGNAAPEIVRERAIFERERFAGLRIHHYLSAKFLWLSATSLAQSLLLYTILKLFGGIAGSVLWQLTALAATTLAATGIGLLISSWSRNVLQAVLLVPVFTIPQILFSGYVFKLEDWHDRPAPRVLSRTFPGFASQRLVDTSLLWQQPIGNYDELDQAGHLTSYENLATALRPTRSWLGIQPDAPYQFEESQLYSAVRGLPMRTREGTWNPESPVKFRLGATYAWSHPAIHAIIILLLWTTLTCLGSYFFLRQQRE